MTKNIKVLNEVSCNIICTVVASWLNVSGRLSAFNAVALSRAVQQKKRESLSGSCERRNREHNRYPL